MTTSICVMVAGIVLQVFGALLLVIQSFYTSRKLGKYGAHVAYDNFSVIIADLAHEMANQFRQQLVGFAFLLVGAALQLYSVIIT